jgi:peptide/nickel transport system substrate-binding protein
MKKILLICFSIIILSSLIFGSCGEAEETTPATTTPATTTPATTTPATTTPATTTPATTPAATPTGKQQYGGTLIIVCDESIDALGYPAEAQPKGMLYYKSALPVIETLLNQDNKENLLPGLAESWDISPDGKTVTLHLQKNVKFHDGTDFNAEAVKINLEAWDITYAPYLTNITSIETPDAHTVVLNLKKFDVFLLQRFASGSVGMIASPTAMKKPTTPETMAEDHMVGTGPFKFVSWKRQDYVKYVKNPDYWQPGKPYLDAIEFRFVTDYMTRLLSFEAGEADYTGALYPVEANQLQTKGYRIEPSELTFVWHFFPDGANADSPFSDLKIREAVEYAIDKKTIAQGIGEGFMTPSYQFAQPNAPYYDAGLIERVYNPDKAKQLLADAGYTSGLQTKIITDVRVKMDLVTAVQTYLKEVGIDCELEVADVPRMMSLVRGGWNNAILWQGYPMGSTQMGLYSTFASEGNMVSMYQPAGWQAEWDAMTAVTDDAKRLTLLAELNKKEVENLVAIPLIYDHRLYAAQQKVQNIGWSYGQNALWWDPANAWLSE